MACSAESANMKVYVGKTVLATPDVQPAAFDTFRPTSVTLSPRTQSTESQEITPGRTPRARIITDLDGQGDLGFEFSSETMDLLLQGAMMKDAWSTAVAEAGLTVNFDNPTSQITITAGGDWDGVNEGDAILIGGADIPANNRWFHVKQKLSSSVIVVSPPPADDDADATVTVTHSGSLTIGTEGVTFWIEKVFPDVQGGVANPTHGGSELYKGARVAQLNLNLQPRSLITGSFGFQTLFPSVADEGSPVPIGADGTQMTAPTILAPKAGRPITAITDVGTIIEGGAAIDNLQQVTLTLNNNLRVDSAVGQLGAICIGLGVPSVTGQFRTFLKNYRSIEKAIAGTETDIWWTMSDGIDIYAVTLRKVTFTNAGTPVNAGGEAVLAQLEYAARGISITRYHAA